MASIPEVGTEAPDFTLPSLTMVDGAAVRGELTLSAERGHPVVLAFYPGDETAVCTRQMCAYSAGIETLSGLDARVWGISPQGLDSHEGFARHRGLAMPLLADVDRTVIAAYGLARFGIGLRRSVFVVDAAGVIRWRYVTQVGITFPDVETIARHIPA
jgi:peroxiredoxin Q/BCP